MYESCVVLTPTRELAIIRRFTMLRSRNVSYPNECATKIGRQGILCFASLSPFETILKGVWVTCSFYIYYLQYILVPQELRFRFFLLHPLLAIQDVTLTQFRNRTEIRSFVLNLQRGRRRLLPNHSHWAPQNVLPMGIRYCMYILFH